MTKTAEYTLSKVPEVTLVFWIIKIAATTLGETGGDTVTMTLNWGYLAGTLLFFVALVALVAAQIVAKKFHPFLYWATIISLHDLWHHDGRFCGPVVGDRLHRRFIDFTILRLGDTRPLVLVAWLNIGGHC